jgi:hypothetical protein
MKRKSEFVVNYTMPGCKPASVPVTNGFSGKGGLGLAGNALVGGVIGVGVDVASGATQELTPNPVHANLVCDASSRVKSPKSLNSL